MSQLLFHWGGFGIPAYGFFVGLAIVVGVHLSLRRATRLNLGASALLDTLLVAAGSGIIGAGVFHFLFSGGNQVASAASGGRSFFGSMLGALIGGFLYARWRRAPFLQLADCVFLFVPLGHAIGRIGCWFYGCCHGRLCSADLPFAARFPAYPRPGGFAGSPAFVRHLEKGLVSPTDRFSLPVYPVQWYSIGLLLVVFAVMIVLADMQFFRRRPGSVVALYFVLGGAARFVEEFFRDHKLYWGLVTNAQVVSLLTILTGSAVLYAFSRRGANTAVRVTPLK